MYTWLYQAVAIWQMCLQQRDSVSWVRTEFDAEIRKSGYQISCSWWGTFVDATCGTWVPLESAHSRWIWLAPLLLRTFQFITRCPREAESSRSSLPHSQGCLSCSRYPRNGGNLLIHIEFWFMNTKGKLMRLGSLWRTNSILRVLMCRSSCQG